MNPTPPSYCRSKSSARRSVLAAALVVTVLASCGVDDPTPIGDESAVTTVPAATTPPVDGSETDEQVDVVARIAPFLSSEVAVGDFAEDSYRLLFAADRLIESDEARSAFIERFAGPSTALLDIDLDAQFVVVMLSGRCTVPMTPPDLVIDDTGAFIDEMPEEIECYAPVHVVRFYAVDVELRDRFAGVMADLSEVISTGRILTPASSPTLVDDVDQPTWVESSADTAVLAAGIDDLHVRNATTNFANQTKLLVPEVSCTPGNAIHRIVLGDELRFVAVRGTEAECSTETNYLAVFWLTDAEVARIEPFAADWPSLSDGVEVFTPVGPNTSWSDPGDVLPVDGVTSHVISTQDSLTSSTIDVDFGTSLPDVDLETEFIVIIAREDCSRTNGDGIVVDGDRWTLTPPLPPSLPCETPRFALRGHVLPREHLPAFADLPEGQAG